MSTLSDILDFQNLLGFLLILFRVLGVFLAAPLLGNRAIPSVFTISFSFILSVLLFPVVKFEPMEGVHSDLMILQYVLQEVTIGVIIGFVAAIVFAAVQAAGEIFGIKLGFSIAQIIDPSNNGSSSVFGSFYVILGALIFLYLNGHHAIIAATVQSFHILPIGDGFVLSRDLILSDYVVKMTVVAIQMAAPVIVVLTLLSLIFGFITKLSPQMNIYFNVGFIIGPVLGLITIMVTLPLFRVLMTNLTLGLEADLVRALTALKGV
jgi:flagellar biosynthetic protein FliR